MTYITDEQMEILGTYMVDEYREQLHCDCDELDNDEFVARYCELDERFYDILKEVL